MQRVNGIYYAQTEQRGMGVFTAQKLTKDSIIEICPIIELNEKDKTIIHGTSLHDYYFLWGENMKQCAIALGFGSLYNHETHPNANFILDFGNKTIEIFAIKDIAAGEEITINYHGEAGNKDQLWFEEH